MDSLALLGHWGYVGKEQWCMLGGATSSWLLPAGGEGWMWRHPSLGSLPVSCSDLGFVLGRDRLGTDLDRSLWFG